ncbi:MAG: MMPL family transporter, partial [Candidatus Thermoplasmatota archaeon]|nr:MMPL family transporter [Candidatus Thermoplasmatota archaeon]
GPFSIPAKLSSFTAGTRYYQTSFLKRLGGRIQVNTSYIFEKIPKLQSKFVLGPLVERILSRIGDLSWETFDELYTLLEDTSMMPDVFALQDILESWTTYTRLPMEGEQSDHSLFIIPAFYEELSTNSVSFLSKDFQTDSSPQSSLAFLRLDFITDFDTILEVNQHVLNEVNKLNAQQNVVQINATGNGIASIEINELTQSANRFIAPMILIIIVLVLLITFRKPSYVILPILTLVVSTIWLLGSMVLLGISFNVIAIALIPLILGLGVDYSVHLLHNYRVEIEDGKKPGIAIKNSVTEIGTAMFLAMLTTVIAFLSFLSATVPPIREFGILLALGVSFTFITALTLLGSLRYILDRRVTATVGKKMNVLRVRLIMRFLSSKIIHNQKIIVVMIIALTIFFAYGAVRIDTVYDVEQFAPEQTPAFELFDQIAKGFPFASQTQEFILLEGNVATVEVLKGIKDTHEDLKAYEFVARNPDDSLKVTSVYTIIKQAVANDQNLIEKFNIDPDTFVPATDQDVELLFNHLYYPFNVTEELDDISFYFDAIDIELDEYTSISFDQFGGELSTVLAKENEQYVATVIRIYIDTAYINSGDDERTDDKLKLLKTELITYESKDYGDVTTIVTGQNIITLTITSALTESQIISTLISIVLAAFVLIVVYRSSHLGLIALLPVGFSIIWILGTMYYIGYTLNALTITVTSITIGIGIDYSIHATERFRFIVDKTGNITKAVCETVSHTGGALLIAALTTALGFSVLIFAPIPPQQQFGFILAVTILYSFLTSIFILPLVLFHWANKRQHRYGYVINSKTLSIENGKRVKNNQNTKEKTSWNGK